MKILFVAPLNSVHSRRWIQYFADKGTNEVYVLNFEEQTVELTNVNVMTIRLPGGFWKKCLFFVPIISRARSFIRKTNPDFIHVHWVSFAHYFLFWGLSFPLVITPWGSDILINTKKFFISCFIRKFLPQGSLFICDARHLKDKLIELGADQAKVQLIYFGTDVRKFHPDRKDRSIWKELGFEEGVSIVLSLRALKPIYDVRTFILSIPEILREYGSARFVAVGRGEEKPKLVQLVQELGITEKVRFLEGLSDETMQKVVASADVYVSTSLSDGGLAASTAEAMACEVPVVVTDFGENGKWVENGVSGFLFPLSDHRELAQKVVDLLKDPAYAKDIARAGRRVIEERNNYYKEMEKTEALYEKIIQG